MFVARKTRTFFRSWGRVKSLVDCSRRQNDFRHPAQHGALFLVAVSIWCTGGIRPVCSLLVGPGGGVQPCFLDIRSPGCVFVTLTTRVLFEAEHLFLPLLVSRGSTDKGRPFDCYEVFTHRLRKNMDAYLPIFFWSALCPQSVTGFTDFLRSLCSLWSMMPYGVLISGFAMC